MWFFVAVAVTAPGLALSRHVTEIEKITAPVSRDTALQLGAETGAQQLLNLLLNAS